jgi:hypothetical protein
MSMPYYGGMRHIHVIPGIRDQACGEIRNLTDEEVEKILSYIGEVKSARTTKDEITGSADAIMRHIGKFSFNEGELEALLSMVLRSREAGSI